MKQETKINVEIKEHKQSVFEIYYNCAAIYFIRLFGFSK